MNESELKKIIETIEGYKVKNLTWKPVDNIIVGLVKYPYADPKLRDGWICVQWKRNGTPTYRNCDRKDLTLKMIIK